MQETFCSDLDQKRRREDEVTKALFSCIADTQTQIQSFEQRVLKIETFVSNFENQLEVFQRLQREDSIDMTQKMQKFRNEFTEVTEESKRHRDNNTALVQNLERQVNGQSGRLGEITENLRTFESYVD